MLKKVLIITQYSLPDHKRNMNAYQRVFYGANHAEVHLLIRREQSVSAEIENRVSLHRAPCENRWLFLSYAVLLALLYRFKGCRIILTEPSGFAAVGIAAKFLAGYFWVMDVWDRPRWRTGFHEEGSPKRFSDWLVFTIMGFADLYLLSVLPRAAKDINPHPGKCLQLYNAIDLSGKASRPPLRSAVDPTLHLAYGRSEFHATMGLQLVIKAAEQLKAMHCPVVIHLVGELPEENESLIKASEAASIFQVHGFISETRAEFFRKIHVGLVPYLAYEDLSYIFPIKVLEHLSQGNPVIVSRVPGLCSMITHEFNGLIFEPGDAEQLAEAIQRLQQDRHLWEKLAWNALESVEKYSAREKNQTIFNEIFQRENSNQ
jgi:glycosyltransferase involved in cell wall biosynthesis